jgi:hypothetical protein
MVQWVNSEGATIEKMLDQGRLWVVDKLPPMGLRRNIFEAEAEEKDTAYKLIARWAGSALPRNSADRERQFEELVKASGPSVLVLHNAHLLRGDRLIRMRLFSENFAPVILVGDALTIGAKIINQKNAAEFMMRASFCITPITLFE